MIGEKKNREKIRYESLFLSSEKSEYFVFKNYCLWTETNKRKREKKILLDNINIRIGANQIWGIIGPSGAGKSLLISSMSKGLFDSDKKYSWSGEVIYKGTEILGTDFPIELLRKKIGWIAQTPVLFPLTIRENILFALRARGMYDPKYLEKRLQEVLLECALWEELKDRLDHYPMDTLSVGQAQRLCIARALILEPEMLLLDEPTSALDPASTTKIEQLILKLARKITIVLVSHSMSQVKHVADFTIFIKNGKIVEQGATPLLFTYPKTKELKKFILGQY
ncbi:phosphate import ATP-binding protein PstB [Candidatus Mycoplasma haematolamae str. Purdue]|uniref:Phosphate import ATP-binding protein PstB n=1 Tax=Mycoplasma haematolamae (strain Purdue) TaxID=1212765 RepID=I7B9U1_MYCHA|nr:ATP-binding cassette domain-containing protein [Candidatus Mycoplasma haematolamae]AFO52035.1 phosphate import ATP-binding protein PstB [Candidatus Mycoplasma haematolamae str. Purdue]